MHNWGLSSGAAANEWGCHAPCRPQIAAGGAAEQGEATPVLAHRPPPHMSRPTSGLHCHLGMTMHAAAMLLCVAKRHDHACIGGLTSARCLSMPRTPPQSRPALCMGGKAFLRGGASQRVLGTSRLGAACFACCPLCMPAALQAGRRRRQRQRRRSANPACTAGSTAGCEAGSQAGSSGQPGQACTTGSTDGSTDGSTAGSPAPTM